MRGRDGIAGRDGRDGRDGQQGLKGDKGEQGMKGKQGIKGEQGMKGEQGPIELQGPMSGGVAYIRWGQTICPTGATLVYSGKAAGSHYSKGGGATNHLCLPNDPEYLQYQSGKKTGISHIYAAEYEYTIGSLSSLHNHNVPCAICYVSNRTTVLMIPAKITCPTSWTKEYRGYLMAEKFDYKPSTYECIDEHSVGIPGSIANTDGALFHHVEPRCSGVLCPPYDETKELACVVCTK